MHKETEMKKSDLERKTPFYDFEITINAMRKDEKKQASKGRFLFWGDVPASDCPA
ncbi:hypothetical protein RYZ26_09905 [Terasakiella sp. A23]|uniref:hypothetical protein n=1 Tax=Terasakiella sp. FCG-A23 TaxID=3080561 RepID=UPI002952ED4B|nr:hypothetical protein [Terasakiella sp. A23]MDV7339908.1 hypothetical protein [Terasakiella sp. A23]